MSVHEGSKWQEMKEDSKIKIEEVSKTKEEPQLKTSKTLNNTTASQAKQNVKDIQFWGDGDTFKLISKASSENEGWMKSTKAMEIKGVGCVVQVTTQQKNLDCTYSIAEALTFVPNTTIIETLDTENKVISRKLMQI